jgi:hypothetical protein
MFLTFPPALSADHSFLQTFTAVNFWPSYMFLFFSNSGETLVVLSNFISDNPNILKSNTTDHIYFRGKLRTTRFSGPSPSSRTVYVQPFEDWSRFETVYNIAVYTSRRTHCSHYKHLFGNNCTVRYLLFTATITLNTQINLVVKMQTVLTLPQVYVYLLLEFKWLRSQSWNQALILTVVLLLATSALSSSELPARHTTQYGFELRLFQTWWLTRLCLNTTSTFWSGYEVFFTIKLSSHSSKCAVHHLDNISLVMISHSRQHSRGTCSLSTCQGNRCLLWNKSPPVDPNQARWIHSTSSCPI